MWYGGNLQSGMAPFFLCYFIDSTKMNLIGEMEIRLLAFIVLGVHIDGLVQDVTQVRWQWSYVFLALSHRYVQQYYTTRL